MAVIENIIDPIIENPSYPRGFFVSPFRRNQQNVVKWKTVATYNNKYILPDTLSQNELSMFRELGVINLAPSSYLISKYYTDRTYNNAKLRLRKLVERDFIINHSITLESGQQVVVYTLNYNGAKMINAPFIPNWWLGKRPSYILDHLLLHKLFTRIKEIDNNSLLQPAFYPYNAIIEVKNLSFLVSIAHKSKVSKGLEEENNRLIILCENLLEVEEVAKKINNPNIRYITDYGLFSLPLSNALLEYDYEIGLLKSTTVELFKNV